MPSSKVERVGNALLDRLSKVERARVKGAAKIERLSMRTSIFERGDKIDRIYFPLDCVISDVFTMNDGSQVEVGMIGSEGMTPFPMTRSSARSIDDLYVQIEGSCLHISRRDLLNAVGSPLPVGHLFAAYAESRVSTLAQYSACNRLHSVEQRLARWLLMAHDRTANDKIPLTQEFLGLMLGVRRESVTVVIKKLESHRFIRHSRGLLTLSDRSALQRTTCECYDAVEDRFAELMGYTARKHRSA